jgi:hypothetical protein
MFARRLSIHRLACADSPRAYNKVSQNIRIESWCSQLNSYGSPTERLD